MQVQFASVNLGESRTQETLNQGSWELNACTQARTLEERKYSSNNIHTCQHGKQPTNLRSIKKIDSKRTANCAQQTSKQTEANHDRCKSKDH